MDPARFAKLREVYEHAAELPSGERTPYLDATCGDDAGFAREVRRMLAAQTAPDFLARPDEATAASPLDIPPALPETVGPFLVHDIVGEGGYGVVYRAEQREPVQRTVALKVLHHSRSDTRSVLRFQAESQTLALLQHPGIARLFDAGRSDEGLSYFAMELVEGPPITAYCDERRLALDARLEVFLRVCAAVQHAHQRGVVHRDLKPSNVLVEELNGRPAPKVIDFGIAKLVDEAASGRGFTREGAPIGTPGYMSPEQAAGEQVDTRTDVYALGVLLYDLLAGDLPFPRERLASRSPVEVLRIVREEEPRSLSAVVHKATESADAIALRRSCDRAALVRALRSDLEWIVRRALAKDPDERYASVTALIADVERYRRNEPVSAREPATLYLLRKFIARHRWGVGIGLAVAMTLVVGIAGLGWGLSIVSDARDLAVERGREADRQRDRAVLSEYAAHLAAARAALASGDARGARRHLLASAPRHRGWEWRHLAAQCDGALATFPVAENVWQVAWLDAQRLLARTLTSSTDRGAIVEIDTTTGVVERRIVVERATGPLRPELDDFIVVDSARERIVVDARVRLELYDLRRGGAPTVFFEPEDDVRSMALAPDGRTLYTSDNGGAVRVFDLEGVEAPRVLCRLEVHCRALAPLSGGARLALATGDGEVQLRSTVDGELLAPPTALADEAVLALAVSVDGRTLYAAAANRIHALAADDGELLARRSAGVELHALELSADGRTLYGSGGWTDSALTAWNAQTLEVLSRFHGHRLGIRGLAMHPDGERLASSSRDGTVRIWPARAPRSVVRLEVGFDARDLSVARDGSAFATADRGGRVSVWDAESLEERRRFELDQVVFGCVLGAQEVFVGGEELVAIERATGAERRGDPPPVRVGRLALDPAERWLASTHWTSDRFCIWRLPELALVHDLELPVFDSAVFDPSRGVFVAGSQDGRLFSIDPESGAVLESRQVSDESAIVLSLAVHETQLAVVSGGLHILDVDGDAPDRSLASLPLVSAAFAPDGSRLATGGTDRLLHIWNREETEVLVLDDAPKSLELLSFAADGRNLLGLSYRPGSTTYVMVWRAPAQVQLEE